MVESFTRHRRWGALLLSFRRSLIWPRAPSDRGRKLGPTTICYRQSRRHHAIRFQPAEQRRARHARNHGRIAREGEALGYDYLTVTDHVVLPDMAEPGYPYSESGAFYSTDSAHRHEMLTLAAWLASVTARVRLVLAVLVVPHRPAVLAAKQLATIDVLSGGRLTVGIGAGWLKAEFDAVVTTPFRRARRGHRRICRRLPHAVDREEAEDRRALCALRRAPPRAEAGAAAASADLGRRRERPVVAPRRAAGRRLVSDRHQQRASARQPAALPGRDRAAAPA